jgi:hypothetical protein
VRGLRFRRINRYAHRPIYYSKYISQKIQIGTTGQASVVIAVESCARFKENIMCLLSKLLKIRRFVRRKPSVQNNSNLGSDLFWKKTDARSLCRAFHETFSASRCVDGACPFLFDNRFYGVLRNKRIRSVIEDCIFTGDFLCRRIDSTSARHCTERLALVVNDILLRLYRLRHRLGQGSVRVYEFCI